MIDPAVAAYAYALCHATHGIADYWVQRDWQAQAKSKKGLLPFTLVQEKSPSPEDGDSLWWTFKWTGWNTAVWSHAIEYATCFLPTFWLLGMTYEQMALGWLMVLIPHAWMDTRRFLNWFVHKTKGWAPGDLGQAFIDEVLDYTPPCEDGCCGNRWNADPLVVEGLLYKAAVRVHVNIHMDQHFHKACLMALACWVGWR